MQIKDNQVVTVFKNENQDGKVSYAIGIMKKDENGEKQYANILTRFRKGVELENKTKIVINNAWISFYRNPENKAVFYVFVENFTKVENQEGTSAEQSQTAKGEELPF